MPDCLSAPEEHLALFSGCNVQIVNGEGDTETTNELGNLIVGYNKNEFGASRSGSHNLVVGDHHEYSSFGGFVAGVANTIVGQYASVSGGEGNTGGAPREPREPRTERAPKPQTNDAPAPAAGEGDGGGRRFRVRLRGGDDS